MTMARLEATEPRGPVSEGMRPWLPWRAFLARSKILRADPSKGFGPLPGLTILPLPLLPKELDVASSLDDVINAHGRFILQVGCGGTFGGTGAQPGGITGQPDMAREEGAAGVRDGGMRGMLGGREGIWGDGGSQAPCATSDDASALLGGLLLPVPRHRVPAFQRRRRLAGQRGKQLRPLPPPSRSPPQIQRHCLLKLEKFVIFMRDGVLHVLNHILQWCQILQDQVGIPSLVGRGDLGCVAKGDRRARGR